MSEFDLQKFVVSLLRLNAVLGLIWYAIPNGEYRSPRTGARLKAMGVRRGAADLALVLPDGRAAFLELKTAKGRQSPDQKAFELACNLAGTPYRIVRSPEEAATVLTELGAIATNPLRTSTAYRRAA